MYKRLLFIGLFFSIFLTLPFKVFSNVNVTEIDSIIKLNSPLLVPVTCIAPTNLSATALNNNSVAINWLNANNPIALTFEISYGGIGFTAGLGTEYITTNKPDTIYGLSSGSTYEFYVRAICSVGDTSAWSLVGSFSSMFSIPFSQDFEGFPNGLNISTNGWTNSRGTSIPDWTCGNSTASFATGPTQDHTTGIGLFLYLETSGGTAGISDTLSSASIYVDSSQNAINLSYWYHMAGATMGEMQVWIASNGIWDSLTTYTGQQHINQTDPWLVNAHPLANYSGQSIQLKFIGTRGSSFTGDLAIDDVIVSDSPICFPPSALTSSNPSLNTIDLDWRENNMATNWFIEYGPRGFTPGTGNFVNATVKPYTLLALSPSSEYDFYVTSNCGIGNQSSPSIRGSFSTLNGVPYFQHFESFNLGSNISDKGWTNVSSTNPQWTTGINTPSVGTGPLVDHTIGTAGKFLFLESSAPALVGMKDTASSPDIIIGALQSTLTFSFWYHMAGATMGELQVWVDTGGVWDSITSITGVQQLNQTDPWLASSHLLSAYAGQTIQIKFIGIRGTSFTGDIAIDDIVITNGPPCFPPSNLISANSTFTTVDLDWTENNLASNWDIEYGPKGYTPGTGTLINTSSKPYTLTGLSSNSEYDFYVNSNCSVGSFSNLSLVGNFTTLNRLPYSQDFEEFTLGNFISDKDWVNNSVTNPEWTVGTSTPSVGTGPTKDHTLNSGGKFLFLESSAPSALGLRDTLTSAQIHIGASQTNLELNFWYHMHGATMGSMQVWLIDSLGVMDSLGAINGQQQSNQINAWLKQTFLITGYQSKVVRVIFIGIAGSSFTSDMSIDDVHLDEQPAANIGISNIISPSSSCGLTSSDSVSVQISNYGTAAQSGFNVGYSINGVAISPETVSANLAVGASINYTFSTTANLSNAGFYTIDAYTLLTNDALSSNDSLSNTINKTSTISSFPYTESFETSAANWVVYGNTSWELGSPNNSIIDTASHGTQAWVTDLDANYTNNEAGAVYSPCFNFSSINNPNIAFDIWWNAENSWDGAVLQSSVDNGMSWQIVGAFNDSINWYNDNTIDAIGDNGIENSEQGWTGVPGSNGWLRAEHRLTGLGGISAVRLRIAFASDGNTTNEGIAFDNVEIFDQALPDPYYPIGIINTEDVNGVADSLSVNCFTSGTVVGIDLDGNSGLQFYIIDQSTGVQEGINVFSFVDINNYTVNEGDSILIHGYVFQFAGLTELFVDSIHVVSTGNSIPTPIPFATLDESTEAKYLELSSNYTLLDTSRILGSSYNLRAYNGLDTIAIRVDRDADVFDSLIIHRVFVGDTICDLKGIGAQFDNVGLATSGYYIFAMRYSDFTVCQLTTGIEDQDAKQSSFSINPNPNNGQFEIRTNGFNNSTIQLVIRDVNGRIIKKELIRNAQKSFQKSIDLSRYSKGMYFISIEDGDTLIQEKLILF